MIHEKATLSIALLLALYHVDAKNITVSSKDFQTHTNFFKQGQIASMFVCHGNDLSPELSWSSIPTNAKSLAITEYDPDAPTGSGFWHWIAYNIDVNTTSIKTGASRNLMPVGAIEALNDYGTTGYLGALSTQRTWKTPL